MRDTYNWGILGLGNIAHKFASALSATGKGKLLAVGSRNVDKAESFAGKYKVERWYGSYDQLINDENIDIVYIATPHNHHYEFSKKCLEAGKNVLCEKPITINHFQFNELRELARSKNLFYMDALWTRFLPHVKRIIEYIDNDRLGDVKFVRADFGIKPSYDVNSRLFNLKLGGGSLLDIGIYPVFLSLLILGYPEEINVSAVIGETGVDESCSMSFRYPNGAIANLSSTFLVNTDTSAEIAGTRGRIQLNRMFFMPTSINIYLDGESKSQHEFAVKNNGYELEAEEVMNCLDKGLIESTDLPLDFTSDLMRLLDEIRQKAGIVYMEDKLE